MRETFSEI